MNDKIEKLLNELGWGMGDPGDDCMQCSPFDPYKFAELIVRECAEICLIEYDTGLEMASQAPWIAKQIKDHFGVEE
jgi:hypothetical protein